MKSLKPGDDSPMRLSRQTQTSGGNADDWSAVVSNERMTALASAVLLVLIVIELVTSASLHVWLTAHVFVGVLLSALLLGVIAAILFLPAATPLIAWSQTNVIGPGPFIVGMIVAALALLVTRPLRWR